MNHFYFYYVDDDEFGPSFLKFGSYFGCNQVGQHQPEHNADEATIIEITTES